MPDLAGNHTYCSYRKWRVKVSGLAFHTFCGYDWRMLGRPKKPTDQVRNNVLRIRLTEGERVVLDQAAQEQNEDTSTWARTELLARAKYRRPQK